MDGTEKRTGRADAKNIFVRETEKLLERFPMFLEFGLPRGGAGTLEYQVTHWRAIAFV